jgi:hypothetical protein
MVQSVCVCVYVCMYVCMYRASFSASLIKKLSWLYWFYRAILDSYQKNLVVLWWQVMQLLPEAIIWVLRVTMPVNTLHIQINTINTTVYLYEEITCFKVENLISFTCSKITVTSTITFVHLLYYSVMQHPFIISLICMLCLVIVNLAVYVGNIIFINFNLYCPLLCSHEATKNFLRPYVTFHNTLISVMKSS